MPHPGDILFNDYLAPTGLSQNALARAIGVPPRRINEIVLGKRAVSADTALRLAAWFGNEAEYWLALQSAWELDQARHKLGAELSGIESAVGSKVPDSRARAGSREPAVVTRPGTKNIRRRILR